MPVPSSTTIISAWRMVESLYHMTLYAYTREAVIKQAMQMLADGLYNSTDFYCCNIYTDTSI